MGIHKVRHFCHCWQCGYQRLGETLATASGRPLGAVLELMRGLPRFDRDGGLKRTPGASNGVYRPPAGVGPLQKPHKRFLLNRGFDPDELYAVWGVRGIGLAAGQSWRLFIPCTLNHQPASWTTRMITADGGYQSARPDQETVPLKDMLYGEDLAGHAVVVVEGPPDAWAIGPGAVATCGVSYTRAQVDRMAAHPVRVICFDSEPRAQMRATKLAADLACFPGETYVVRLETGKDASRASRREVLEIRKRFLT